MREFLYHLFHIPHFTFRGKLYNGNKYELVPDPSDTPPPDWKPPGGDWRNWKQDQMVRRKK